eukprot:TRINITY_DN4787_c0_g1_i2.p1 TRINITY_DN4787_c0_g1~~TRINITY_DN4787_c0_g1_i2.p1  ORF type:complete len:251 (+),score=56.95 TRINITY_DN4787_c0_g1_i2:68-820(+)
MASQLAKENNVRISDRLIDIERSLSAEIQRRQELEAWTASQVDTQVRNAIGRALGAVEEEVAAAHRHHVQDTRAHFVALDRGLADFGHRLERLEADMSSPRLHRTERGGSGAAEMRQLSWLEGRVAKLEQQRSQPSEILPVEVAKQLQLIRSQLLDEGFGRCQYAVERARVDTDDVRQRLDALECWLREAVAPELVRAQLDLVTERQRREQLEAKVGLVSGENSRESSSLHGIRHKLCQCWYWKGPCEQQ